MDFTIFNEKKYLLGGLSTSMQPAGKLGSALGR
jgi:hypothetical protein